MSDLRDSKGKEQSDVHENRRRPGRVEYVNSYLIKMMRRPSESVPDAEADVNDGDIKPDYRDSDLGPAKGIIVSIIIGAILWFLIISALFII
ncbi:hypothetical protein [Acidiphilium acidophilum]|uniref:hypothetical protein n=1 Tax=Acidiphilium acidophilum TaxID=76588 RepID=UPI002E8E6E61|nr:hypothetical protein [Acidiphilium acidophilum]